MSRHGVDTRDYHDLALYMSVHLAPMNDTTVQFTLHMTCVVRNAEFSGRSYLARTMVMVFHSASFGEQAAIAACPFRGYVCRQLFACCVAVICNDGFLPIEKPVHG